MGDLNLDVINEEVSKVISIAKINPDSDFLISINSDGLTSEQVLIYSKKIQELVLDYKNHNKSKQRFLVVPSFGVDSFTVSELKNNTNYLFSVNVSSIVPSYRKLFMKYLKSVLTEFCQKRKGTDINQGFLVLPVPDNDTVKIKDIAKLSDDDLAKYGLKKL